MLKTLRACSLSLLVLQSTTAIWVAAPVAAVAFSSPAEARSGYSRPSRTPSVSMPRAPSRRPSVGSSYARPERSPSVVQGFGASASDRAYSARRSAEALDRMRASQDAARRAAEAPRPAPAEPRREQGGGWWTGTRDNGSRDTGSRGAGWGSGGRDYRPDYRQDHRPEYRPGGGWYADRGWAPPPYATAGAYGNYDAFFLWYLLANLNQAGHSDFFRNHWDEPGLRQWRGEADRLAAQNADLRRQLDDLDRRVGEARAQGAAPDPSYLPPDVPASVAAAPRAEDRRTPSVSSGGGGGWLGVLFFALLLGGIAFFAWRVLGRKAMGGRGGVPATGTAASVATAARIVKGKVTGEGVGRKRFRVGMTLTADPTPFLLASGTKVPMPKAALEGGLTSVAAVGRLEGEPGFVRLHMGEGEFFELHLASGDPDECRYFALIDTEAPADEGEWEAWLKPGEGMIGWEAFETRDKKLYGRVWQPGPEWVEPRERVELVESLDGTRRVTTRSMLYAAPTGVPEPGPQAEYILVSAVEDDTGARVEIRAGFEVNPASISIP